MTAKAQMRATRAKPAAVGTPPTDSTGWTASATSMTPGATGFNKFSSRILQWTLGLRATYRDVFRAADAYRMAMDTTTRTKRFAEMWESFRREHVELDDRGKYRRNRYWIWRAAVLKEAHERGGCFLHGRGFSFQDVIDASMVRDKLAEAMDNAGGVEMYALDGSATQGGYSNFWRPCWTENEDGKRQVWPIHDYAAMVLSLVRAVS